MVMPLMWMHKSSSKALFTKVPWNPRSVSTSCCLEGFSICFQNLHHSLLAESYLANLALYPGRSELPFLPANTQALILQPIGDKGIAIVGGDTIRGFTNIDQAWIAMIADKLGATLSKS